MLRGWVGGANSIRVDTVLQNSETQNMLSYSIIKSHTVIVPTPTPWLNPKPYTLNLVPSQYADFMNFHLLCWHACRDVVNCRRASQDQTQKRQILGCYRN